jgi:thiosulfate/3-mercaptopyruvate sulfurtransferase
MTHSLTRITALLCLAAAMRTAPAAPRLTNGHATPKKAAIQAESLLVSVKWVAAHLNDPNIIVLHVDHTDSAYVAGHIPGSRLLNYMAIIENRDNRGAELPSVDSLRRLFEGVGVSNGSRVILYGPDVLMTARAFFTLEYLGHANVSIMDGGIGAWRSAGNALTKDVSPARRGAFTPRVRSVVVADAAWIQPRLGRSGLSLLDTRTPDEYNGVGERRGIPSKGHLQGAKHVEWQEYVLAARDDQRLKPREALGEMLRARGVAKTDTVVAYCYIGYRASLSYFVSRLLGYEAKLYDGSYDDWFKRDLPLVKP